MTHLAASRTSGRQELIPDTNDGDKQVIADKTRQEVIDQRFILYQRTDTVSRLVVHIKIYFFEYDINLGIKKFHKLVKCSYPLLSHVCLEPSAPTPMLHIVPLQYHRR